MAKAWRYSKRRPTPHRLYEPGENLKDQHWEEKTEKIKKPSYDHIAVACQKKKQHLVQILPPLATFLSFFLPKKAKKEIGTKKKRPFLSIPHRHQATARGLPAAVTTTTTKVRAMTPQSNKTSALWLLLCGAPVCSPRAVNSVHIQSQPTGIVFTFSRSWLESRISPFLY